MQRSVPLLQVTSLRLSTWQAAWVPVRRWVLLLGLLGVAGFVYAVFATGGTGKFSMGFNYFDELAQGFLAGHLYLPIEPKPELLALPNPWDPDQNACCRLHDASFYQGHFYLYWGPVTALLHAAARVVTGRPLPDSLAQTLAALVATCGFALILGRVRQQHMPAAPIWLVWGSSLAFALGGSMLFLVGRPSIYHEPLLVAMACLLPAWYVLLRAAEFGGGGRRRCMLLLVGLLLALAVGARMTYLGYAAGPGLGLISALVQPGRARRRGALLDLAVYAVPLVGVGLLLAWYNWARFGSPLEFGVYYTMQGSAQSFHNIRGANGFTPSFVHVSGIPLHFALYVLAVPKLSLVYPYFAYAGTGVWFPDYTQYQGIPLEIELPAISPVFLAPTSLLALVLPALFLPRQSPPLAPMRTLAWSICLGLLLTLVLLCSFQGVSFRYSSDILPALALLGALTLLHLAAALTAQAGPHLSPHQPWFRLARREFSLVSWSHLLSSGGLRAVLSACVVAAWVVSAIVGLMLGVGAWGYSFPERAVVVSSISNAWLARLHAALAPSSIPDWVQPEGATTWRQEDGHYRQGALIYLRAPAPRPALALSVTPDPSVSFGTELVIRVRGRAVWSERLRSGQQLVLTPPLVDLSAGTLAAVELELPNQQTVRRGFPLPVVVSSLRFTRTPEEARLYALSLLQPDDTSAVPAAALTTDRRQAVDHQRAAADRQRADAARDRAFADALRANADPNRRALVAADWAEADRRHTETDRLHAEADRLHAFADLQVGQAADRLLELETNQLELERAELRDEAAALQRVIARLRDGPVKGN